MILTDTCLSLGMEVPELQDKDASFVISALDFPPHAPPPKNPVDFAGTHTAFMDATVINRLAQLDYIDGIISYRPITFHSAASDTSDKQREMDTKVGELLSEVPNKYGKPVVLLGISGLITSEEFRSSDIVDQALESSGILSYQTMEDAAMAMYTLVRYAEIKKRKTFFTGRNHEKYHKLLT
jgi:acyl-CoA synthetase (NDP forming)